VLVFYPDKEEYRRALLGSLSYLGTWLAWELDDQKRGRQAAQAWKNANDLTLECWNMACLEQLQEDVAAIRALLAGADYCCNGNTTINPGPGQTTEIEPGVGDPPPYYGETEITSWEDWEEHVCYNAHRWVDDLIATAETLNEGSNTGIITLGLVAAALALLSFTGLGIPIAITIAITSLSAISAAGALIFADTAQDLEDAREDIVCALINGEDVETVINDALGEASLDYTSFFQHIDYSSATSIIYEGGANGEYLPAETSDECDCEPTYTVVDLDIEAVAFYITATGVGTNGCTSSDPMNTWLDQGVSPEWLIETNPDKIGPADLSSDTWWVIRNDPLSGWDTLTPRVVSIAYGRSQGNRFQLICDHDAGETAGTQKFGNMKVFCDNGNGLEWFDADLTFVSRSAARWSYSTESTWVMITHPDGGNANVDDIVFDLKARVWD